MTTVLLSKLPRPAFDRSAGRRGLRSLAIILVSVAAATLAVATLEHVLGVPDASSVYLVAVVVSAMLAGTVAALGTAVVAVLTYDLVFTAPAFTLQITQTGEWLSLLLLSFVGITVGQLVAIQRHRTDEAFSREREAQALYAVSRALATRTSTDDALVALARILTDRTDLDRVWFGMGPNEVRERVIADTGSGPLPGSPIVASLSRKPEGGPGEWVVVHEAGRQHGATGGVPLRYRILITAAGDTVGSLWGARPRTAPPIDPTTTRLMAATADQVGQTVQQDRLAARAAELKIAQAGDALKSALVESVSHDLRIPLASIRAAAGPLIDPAWQFSAVEVREAAASIDGEAARLDRLVANVLDLGRIQSGMLEAHSEAVELQEVVERTITRVTTVAPEADATHIEQRVRATWVDADPVLLQQAILNVLENAVRHTPRGTRVVISASRVDLGARVRLTIEDAGPGVSPEVMSRLFERFFRAVPRDPVRRPGSGIGLAIARGFVEAMGGRISARTSDLGGLAIDIDLSATQLPDGLLVTA